MRKSLRGHAIAPFAMRIPLSFNVSACGGQFSTALENVKEDNQEDSR
jgi:hypothetical protein